MNHEINEKEDVVKPYWQIGFNAWITSKQGKYPTTAFNSFNDYFDE